MSEKLPFTLRAWLALLVIGVAVPLILFAGVTIWWILDANERERDNALSDRARAIASAVDAETRSWRAALYALAENSNLQAGRLREFYHEARAVAARYEGWIVLNDLSGQQRLNTLLPSGAPLPHTSAGEMVMAVFRDGRPITDLVFGAAAQRYIISNSIPVFRDGQVVLCLSMNFGPERLTRLLAEQKLPSTWVAAIVNRQNRVVARSSKAEERVGKLAPQALQQAVTKSDAGLANYVLTDGREGRAAFQRLAEASWVLALAVPVSELPSPRPLIGFVLVGILLAGVAVGAAIAVAREIAHPIGRLATLAPTLVRGDAAALDVRSGIHEVRQLQEALVEAAQRAQAGLLEREHTEEALRRLNEELEERVQERTAALREANVKLEVANSAAQEANIRLEESNTELQQHVEERQRAEKTLADRNRHLQLLSDTASALLRSRDPQGVVTELCCKVMVALECQAFFNYLADPEGGGLYLNACAGIPPEAARRIERLAYGEAICGRVARDGCPIVAEDIPTVRDPRTELVHSFGITAYACHPLITAGGVIGTLSFGTRTRTHFTEGDLHLMQTVADLVAVAMERVRAERQLQMLAATLEARVQDRTAELARTVQQLERQSTQLRTLATELTLAEERERRRIAEVLHGGLQQLLVGVKLLLSPLGQAADPAVRDASREATELILQAIQASRSLTEELSPPILQRGGLAPALQWLARWMGEKHNLTVVIRADGTAAVDSHDTAVLLFQAIRELLLNVVKHARVEIAEVEIDRRDDQVRVTVTDAGAGFDPGQLRVAGGAAGGFGLLSIHERLELMGGRMEIESAPGEGSRFTLRVPVRPAVAAGEPAAVTAPPGAEAPTGAVAAPAGPPAGGERKIRVLVVDDHPVVRQGLVRLLKEQPDILVVGEAADGQTAVALARDLLPDVVTMDIEIPGMNGIEATRRIHAECPGVGVIGLSIFGEAVQGAAMRDAGAADYLSKRAPAESLLAAVRACARRGA